MNFRHHVSFVRRSKFSFERFKNSFWLLWLTAASVFSINQYRFGIDDHATILTFIKASVNPELYPHDVFLNQRHFFYTTLWTWLGGIHHFTGLDLPNLFFLVYCSVAIAFFAAIFRLTRVLFEDPRAPYLATFFFVFCTQSVGALGILENILINRLAALPVVLFSFSFFAEGKLKTALALQGLAFYLQPVSALHSVVICILTWLYRYRFNGLKQLFPALLILGLLASPMLFWRLTHHPEINPISTADPVWVELMRLRVSYHAFPLHWDRPTIIRLFFFFFLFIKLRTCYPSASEPQKRIFSACWVILFLCAFYTLFTEALPVPGVFIFRWIRSYTFFIVFSVLFLSDKAAREILFEKPGWSFFFWIAAAAGLFYETTKGWAVHYTAFALMCLAMGLYGRLKNPDKVRRFFVPLLAALIFVLSVMTYTARMAAGQKHFTIQSMEEPDWLEAQKWAYQHTDVRDGFIVPPTSSGFRVESERPVYADWKDGALSTYDPAYGKVWLGRMKKLGLNTTQYPMSTENFNRSFLGLGAADFRRMAAEIRNPGARVYLVSLRETHLGFPVHYENQRYKIYEITP